VPRGFFRFLLRRLALAALLVLAVSSAAFVLTRLAPGDGLTTFDADPERVAAERRRLGFDRPLLEQYAAWLARATRMDLGESLAFHKPVASLLQERAGNTAALGVTALFLATIIGIPLGVLTGSRHGGVVIQLTTGLSIVLQSVPPLVTSLALLLVAARTGWFPTSDSLLLSSLALALPLAAVLERLQSSALRDALNDPCIIAAIARGVPRRRVIWRHGLRLSLKPVIAIYGIIVGSVLSGSFVVEIVTTWSGLGDLMHAALIARDIYLVAGCAAAGSVFLAAGILLSDLLLAFVDPRVEVAA
jgi:peptide/nickel transport system permease protein